MMEYKILQSGEADELARIVTGFIKSGWKPHGSLIHTPEHFDNQGGFDVPEVWIQAVTL